MILTIPRYGHETVGTRRIPIQIIQPNHRRHASAHAWVSRPSERFVRYFKGVNSMPSYSTVLSMSLKWRLSEPLWYIVMFAGYERKLVVKMLHGVNFFLSFARSFQACILLRSGLRDLICHVAMMCEGHLVFSLI